MAYTGYHAPGSENKTSCLSLPVLKTSHFLHLLLLLLLSLLLLPPGVLLLVSSPPLLPPSLLSLFSSLLLLSCVPLGWWAARSERPSLLAVYSTLLLVSILLQLGLAAAAVLYRDGAQEGVVSGVKILIKEFRNNSMASQGLSHLQRNLHCCGAESFTDWEDSPWVLAQEKAKVPPSCCKSPSQDCGVRLHPSNIHYSGCVHSLVETISSRLKLICALAGILVVLQVLGLFISIKLRQILLLDL